jgi:MerR family transcriptional regulator, light-induced transcriptional regulator
MYTIKKAAALAGVTVPVMRAWERRYGVVDPQRTASRYRLYDEDAIARVRAMRRLVSEGWSPSAAAASIRASPIEEVRARAWDGGGPGTALPGAAAVIAPAAGEPATDLVEAFVAAAAVLDVAGLEVVLDEMFARGTFDRIVVDHLFPALVALGEAWAQGRVDVAEEHMATAAVLRRLAAAFQAARGGDVEDGSVLVGLPPGARHELGALAFATALRRAGVSVVYLGPDLPVADWVEAARLAATRAVVIGAVTAADQEAAEMVTAAVHAARPDLPVLVGGRAASPANHRAWRVRLPEDLPAAVGLVRRLLAEPAGPGAPLARGRASD